MKTLAEPVAPEEGQVILAAWLVFRGIERHADGSNGQYGWGLNRFCLGCHWLCQCVFEGQSNRPAGSP